MRHLIFLLIFSLPLQAFFSEQTLFDLIVAYQDAAVKKMVSHKTRMVTREQKIKGLELVNRLIMQLEQTSRSYSKKDKLRMLVDSTVMCGAAGLDGFSAYVLLTIGQYDVAPTQERGMILLSRFTATLSTSILVYALFDFLYVVRNPDKDRKLRALLAIKHYLKAGFL